MSQTRSFFERWQRLEEEKAALSEDLKELFAEAKHAGYEPKALREAFRQEAKEAELEANAGKKQKRDEHDALVETYRADLHARNAREAA